MADGLRWLVESVVLAVAVACGSPPVADMAVARADQRRALPWPKPSIEIASLPDQAGLYGIIVKEFVRLGWKTVCVGVHAGDAATAVDPPADVTKLVVAADRRFRSISQCRVDGEEVVDRSGGRDPVAVTLDGAERDGSAYLS